MDLLELRDNNKKNDHSHKLGRLWLVYCRADSDLGRNDRSSENSPGDNITAWRCQEMEFTKKELYDLINRPGPLWLVGADLKGANLSGANLIRANLYSSNLNGADLRWAMLEGATLNVANLEEADLREAFLGAAKLIGAYLHGANLRRADLGASNLRRADLNYADLGYTNLTGADLKEADLSGANLVGANMGAIAYTSEPDLKGAKYTRVTKWPDGYDPERAGAILVISDE
jgi:uncharacterized protein YjbI with pentapeptide repeats